MEDEKTRNGRTASAFSVMRFGPYQLDLRTGELRKHDLKIRLQDQPFQILVALLERPGEVVLREEIRARLWPDGTVVEFDHSINAAVKRLRDALRDSADQPRYIETLVRRGYRFIGKLESQAGNAVELRVSQSEAVGPAIELVPNLTEREGPSSIQGLSDERPPAAPETTAPGSYGRRSNRTALIVAGGLAIVAAVGIIPIISRMRPKATSTYEMTRLTLDSGLTTDPAVSPDSKLLAYATDRLGSGRLHIWVQQFMPDGQAVQLTRGDADDHQPAFSPDGSKLAFRSERAGGGIYLIPAIGGEATLVAKAGRDPRFSPDGRWIAYWQAAMMTAPFVASAGTVYVVPSAGGEPQAVHSDLLEAGVPEWSEDGGRLIVFGRKDDSPRGWDWWVVPAGGGSATSTGALALLRKRGFDLSGHDAPRVASWRADELLFSARLGDSRNVWKVRIDGRYSRVTGDPWRLTSGTGVDAYPALTTDGRLLFASLTSSSDVWILPADTNGVKALGQPRRVTEMIGPHQFASLTTDGKLLAYSSLRFGRPRAWIKNLESGSETPVNSGTEAESVGQLSSDGSLLAYTRGDENGPGIVVPVRGGRTDEFCANCATVYDLSPDKKVVLYRKGDAVRAFDFTSRVDSLFMQNGKYRLYQHKYSPDGRWVTFEGVHGSRSRLFVAAVRNSVSPAPENEWILLTGDEGWADKPRWSPDGNTIYFLSNRDGFFCLWAKRVAAGSKQPIGPPVSIAHFHGSRLSVGNVGSGGVVEISVARDKIAFDLGELTGNIWATSVLR